MRLTDTPPSWARQYVGLPYAPGGMAMAGADCWGLVRLIHARELGIVLPALVDAGLELDQGGADQLDARRLQLAQERDNSGRWQRVGMDEIEVGDVWTGRTARSPHVGVMVAAGQMLHCIRDVGSCLERVGSITWAGRLDAYYRFAGPVRLRGTLQPFAGPRIDRELPAGLTVAEALAAAGIVSTPFLRVFVGDREVPTELWGRVRPRPGRTLTVAAIPAGGQGGGKSALRIVATLAIIAAASIATAGVGGALLKAGYAATTAAIGGAIAGGVVTLGLSLALNALAPPPKQRLSDGSADRVSPTVTGTRNELRLYGVVPSVLGTHRIAPVFGAVPYSETVGDDQFIRVLLIASYGEVELSDIRLGSTPIEQFDGVEIEVRSGAPGEDPIRLYPSTIIEDDQQALLTYIAGDGWVTRRSATNADELSVEVTFPRGLALLERDGERRPASVDVEVEYADAGTGAWRRINAASPTFYRELDLLSRTPEVVFGGSPLQEGRIAWGTGAGLTPDPRPGYLPGAGFSWAAGGWVYAPTTGTYTFGIDGSDAIDLHVRGREVVSWYGQHAPGGVWRTGTIELEAGWHPIRIRVEARNGPWPDGGALALGWQRPGDGGIAYIEPVSFRDLGGVDGRLSVNWFSHAEYDSVLSTTEARLGDPIRRTLAWAVPRGEYDVRVRRLTDNSPDPNTLIDEVYWTALRTIRGEDPVKLAGLAKIAIRIRATDQLQGVVDNVNCLARRICPDWDAPSQSWIRRPTSNPASLYRLVLQGPEISKPVADARLDLAEIQAWHVDNDAKGLGYNAVIDFQGTVLERLSETAAAGRASPAMRDSLYSVARDRVLTTPVQHFTPRNSTAYRGRRVFPEIPHALRVRFLNADIDYQQDERTVLDDGYVIAGRDAWDVPAPTLPEATVFEVLELAGITSPAQAFKHGRYHLATMRLRSEMHEVSTDCEHLVCNRGDLVLVTHDVPLFGQASGRVTRLIVDTADNLVGVVLDEQVIMEAGTEYRLRVRLDTGASFAVGIEPEVGATNELRFTQPTSSGSPRPKVGDLAMFGPTGLETRELVVKSIRMSANLGATLELVDHAPGVHQADVGAIPAFTSGITRPPAWRDGPADPVIENIQSDDWVMIRHADGSLEPRMVITLRRPSGQRSRPVQVQVITRPLPPDGVAAPLGPWTHHPVAPLENRRVSIGGVEVGTTYAIRLRVIDAIGRTSNWVDAEHTVVGNILPPPDVLTFDVSRMADGTRRYSWDLGEIPPDVDGVLIRYQPQAAAADWATMTPLHTGVLDGASPQELNVPPQGSWRFAIKMIDTAGNESANAVFVERMLGRARLPNSVVTFDGRVENWPGTLTDCFRSLAGPVVEAIDDTTWATLAAQGASTWNQWPRWNMRPRSPITYVTPAIDLGAVFATSPEASLVCGGVGSVEFRSSNDADDWSAWVPYDQVQGTSVDARYHQWRITVAHLPPGSPVPTVYEFVADALATPIEQVFEDWDTFYAPAGYRIGVGDVRLPVTLGRFASIQSVNLTFNGLGAGYTYSVVDKDTVAGPRVRVYDSDDQPADATVDVVVRGFAGGAGASRVDDVGGGQWYFRNPDNSGHLLTAGF